MPTSQPEVTTAPGILSITFQNTQASFERTEHLRRFSREMRQLPNLKNWQMTSTLTSDWGVEMSLRYSFHAATTLCRCWDLSCDTNTFPITINTKTITIIICLYRS